MLEQIQIVNVVRDGDDGLIVTFSDETTAAYVIEELLELRPRREPIEIPMARDARPTSGDSADGKARSSVALGRIEWQKALLRLQMSG